MAQRRSVIGFAYIAPNGIGFLTFTLAPVLAAFALSLFRWDIFHPPKFVGIQNYIDLLGGSWDGSQFRWNDPLFWKYFWNTLVLMIQVPIGIAASMFLAVILNQNLRGRNFFRTVFYLPTICSGVGLLLLWKYMYNPDIGLVNQVLGFFGIEGPAWLAAYHWAKPALIIMSVWIRAGGIGMIVYLAALSNIPPELYEAADIDGAGFWAKFRYITFPMLAPTTFFLVITGMIAGFQAGFNQAYVMTKGGPAGATTTISYYIYNHAFQYFNIGYASTIAVFLFFVIFVVTMFNWKFGGRKVDYA
jgi:multiple sugar transport system permease protein